MQTNVIDFCTKKALGNSVEFEANIIVRIANEARIVGFLYDLEKYILQDVQDENSEEARQDIVSLINYFRNV